MQRHGPAQMAVEKRAGRRQRYQAATEKAKTVLWGNAGGNTGTSGNEARPGLTQPRGQDAQGVLRTATIPTGFASTSSLLLPFELPIGQPAAACGLGLVRQPGRIRQEEQACLKALREAFVGAVLLPRTARGDRLQLLYVGQGCCYPLLLCQRRERLLQAGPWQGAWLLEESQRRLRLQGQQPTQGGIAVLGRLIEHE